MKFGIENLGPIKKANIELGDFTIICGKNNCGKTYLTYSLYSFLATIRANLVLNIDDSYFEDCCRNGSTSLDVKKIWPGYNSTLARCMEIFSKRMPFFLGVSQKYERFLATACMEDKDLQIFIKKGIKAKIKKKEKCTFVIEKKQDLSTLKITLENTGERLPKKSNLKKMFQMSCSLFMNDIIPDTFSLTSERTGVAIFTDELATIVANNISRKGKNSVQRIDEAEENKSAPFPLPVMREITFFMRIKKIAKNTSFIFDKYPEILEEFSDIVKGKYMVDEYKGIQYIPQGTERKLFLSESSSSVKALVELNFYLQCCARPGQVLMIDEPELTLHPENQRKLAHLLVHLVNIGLRVLVTTHSDYFVKELNTLLMLNYANDSRMPALQKKYGYKIFDLLRAEQVRVYSADGCTITPVEVSPDVGIGIPSFDENIREMGKIQRDILYGGR